MFSTKMKIKDSFLSNPFLMKSKHLRHKDPEEHQGLKVQHEGFLKKLCKNQRIK